jgi:predicted methyltransferase
VFNSASDFGVRGADVAWTTENYHDLYGLLGADGMLAYDKAVFAALKPGGVFLVSDHVALPGAADAPTTLHRIDPAIVRAQLVAAGFVPDGESDALHNPADDHTLKVFDPSIRGKTDQFMFRFRKPQG